MSQELQKEAALAVIVVTPSNFANLRRTVRHLRAQTIVDQIELILIAETEQAIADHEAAELAEFARVAVVAVGPIANVDRVAAAGVHSATAPVVALVEDHAFPEPGWAAALVDAHRGEWAAVGSTMVNANPHSMLSWVNLLIAYGPWTEPATAGAVDTLPGHNISYKRAHLLAYGEALGEALTRNGELPNALRKRGHHFYLEPAARLAHANPSRLASTVELRFSAGRLYGATRARQERWPPWKRLCYVLIGPLIPVVRFQRLRSELFGAGKRAQLVPRIWPALAFGLLLDGLGQMVGYALGPGQTPQTLAVFEMGRAHHLVKRERALLHV